MGTSEWKYDAEKHLLSNDSPVGAFRLNLEGSLTLKDNVVYRRIHLQKQN